MCETARGRHPWFIVNIHGVAAPKKYYFEAQYQFFKCVKIKKLIILFLSKNIQNLLLSYGNVRLSLLTNTTVEFICFK